MKKEEKEINEKVIEEIRLKKAEIRKFKRGRGGKSGRTPGRVRKAAVFAAALAGLSLCFSWEVSAARPGSSTSVLIFSSSGLMEEGEPVFGFRLSADTADWTKKVVLHAEYEKLGEASVPPESYIWNGIPGGNESFTVKENGIVTCQLNCGEDYTVREGELQLNIINIDNTPPVITGFENIPEEWTNRTVKVRVKAEELQP